jgi:hypothetical protein
MPNDLNSYDTPHSPKKGFNRKAGMTAVLGFALATSAFAFTATSSNAATPAPSAPTVAQPNSSEKPPEMYEGGIDAAASCKQVDGKNDGTWNIVWAVQNGLNDPATVTMTSAPTIVSMGTAFGAYPATKEFTQNVANTGTYELKLKLTSTEDSRWHREYSKSLKVSGSCPIPPVQITTLTCSVGLTVDLSGYPVRGREEDSRGPAHKNLVTVMIDGKDTSPVIDKKEFDDFFKFSSGQLTPVFASHTARVVVEAVDREWSFDRQLSIDCPAPVTNTVTVPGATTTVTVPGPTVTVSASPAPTVTAVPIAIVPAPATAPTAEPVAVTVTPEAATAPTSVSAGGGSSAPDSSIPVWAMGLLAVGALGAAGAGSRLASSRK